MRILAVGGTDVKILTNRLRLPGDPVLDVTDAEVAVTGPYPSRRRLTLACPVLDAARRLPWPATGPEKRPILARLRAGGRSIPVGRVEAGHALLLAGRAVVGARVAARAALRRS